MSDTESTTVNSIEEKEKSSKMNSSNSIKALDSKKNKKSYKIKISNEITVFFVDSYKEYNNLPPEYEEAKHNIQTRNRLIKNEITCQCVVF